jgi:hypothetical protein
MQKASPWHASTPASPACQVLGFGKLSPYEKQWFDKMVPDLQKQIAKGIDFVKSPA